LKSLQLDQLDWPLGRPDRLTSGTVAQMTPADHLIVPSSKRLYWLPRPTLAANISVLLIDPPAAHSRNAARFYKRFHRVLSDRKELVESLPNARLLGANIIRDGL
jgi:hypothetical protein